MYESKIRDLESHIKANNNSTHMDDEKFEESHSNQIEKQG
jgi:hypothetical protein